MMLYMMNTPETNQVAFESTLAAGAPVTARWTNSFQAYAARAVVVKINHASIRIELVETLIANGRVTHEAGRQFSLPNVFGAGWSVNNCVAPAAEIAS
jgi:hypothetical protein